MINDPGGDGARIAETGIMLYFPRHSSFVIRHSSFVIRHSSFVISLALARTRTKDENEDEGGDSAPCLI
jgi:hypothetical protein